MNEPLVSVVIPFYSGVLWLAEAIESVLNQTYNNVEIFIINDGSEEDISDLESKYLGKVKFFKQGNGGPAKARNKGIKFSNGKYIAFLDSDDTWCSNKLELQISFMEKNEYVWSHHSLIKFSEKNRKQKIVDTSSLQGNVFVDTFISFRTQTSTFVVRRLEIITNNIYFPEHKRYGEDGSFYNQLAKDYPLGFVEGAYSFYRLRGINAGNRAEVQLKSKVIGWEEIKNDEKIINILPKDVVIGYQKSLKYLNKAEKIIHVFSIDENHREWIYKIFYLPIYFKFRRNRRK